MRCDRCRDVITELTATAACADIIDQFPRAKQAEILAHLNSRYVDRLQGKGRQPEIAAWEILAWIRDRDSVTADQISKKFEVPRSFAAKWLSKREGSTVERVARGRYRAKEVEDAGTQEPESN